MPAMPIILATRQDPVFLLCGQCVGEEDVGQASANDRHVGLGFRF